MARRQIEMGRQDNEVFQDFGPFGVLALVVATLAVLLAGPASANPGGGRTINCNDAPYNNTISGVVEGDVEVTNGVCTVTADGTVEGNVSVIDPLCDGWDPEHDIKPFVAINVLVGTIEGNVRSSGGPCVMVWLRDGATVEGNVVHDSLGNMGFLGDTTGAIVEGHVVVKAGQLWASKSSVSNQVYGNIICSGDGAPTGPEPGSATDWDGRLDDGGTPAGTTVDGVLSGNYNC